MRERVEFNGVYFYRYPDSPHEAHRRYFHPAPHAVRRGVEALHREVWKAHHGPIPPGCHIHHRDGDPGNNDVANLECLTPTEHARRHAGGPLSERQRRHLARIQELAPAWHRSPAGLAWHRAHGRASWEGRKAVVATCQHCGARYDTRCAQRTDRFCSNACKSAWRRAAGLDNVERACAHCGAAFRANRYSKQRFCSRVCGGKGRRDRAGPEKPAS